ncbi:hypothetical protein BGZ93_006851 [Podila epicladia]|nr:hypothetical protein BGZ92_007494 [Podila epicladia]KAG0099609.1 hypothetical protein BGZ93_006851 [Podila epicladia]
MAMIGRERQDGHLATNAMPGTHPMFTRSISAPHIFVSGLRSDFMGQEYLYHAQPMQQFNTSFQEHPYPAFVSTPHPFDPCPLPPLPPTQSYIASSSSQPTISSTTGPMDDSYAYTSVHPFQMDQMVSSINTLAAATDPRPKPEYTDEYGSAQAPYLVNYLDDSQGSVSSSASCSPTSTSLRGSEDTFGYTTTLSPTRPSLVRSNVPQLELPEEHPPYIYPRHGSLDSIYPIAMFHERVELQGSLEGGTAMQPSSSSRSISSTSSTPPMSSRSRARRASTSTDSKVFSCIFDDCGRAFKRSEHLKRHVRSVHTQEKPFVCPFQACPKKFSRSDNLNQHIRIHRHEKEKLQAKPFTHFSPFHID